MLPRGARRLGRRVFLACDHGPRFGNNLIKLFPWSVAPPPPPWRKFFVSEGIPHRTDSEIKKICSSHFIEPGDFDKQVCATGRTGSTSKVVHDAIPDFA